MNKFLRYSLSLVLAFVASVTFAQEVTFDFDKDYKIPKNLIKICLPSKETKKHGIGELISVELGDTRKNALLIDFDRSSRKANLLATSLLMMTTWLKEAKERIVDQPTN